MSDDRHLVRAIRRFLEDCYPCKCDDSGCPGESEEAAEIVRIVRQYEVKR